MHCNHQGDMEFEFCSDSGCGCHQGPTGPAGPIGPRGCPGPQGP